MKNDMVETSGTCDVPLSKLSIQSVEHNECISDDATQHQLTKKDLIQQLEQLDSSEPNIEGIEFVNYQDESQLESVMKLVGQDLSEPYSIFTYRYFLHHWPELCMLAVSTTKKTPIGCVVCKIDIENEEEGQGTNLNTSDNYDCLQISSTSPKVKAGYIAMLAVEESYRRAGIGSALVQRIVKRMKIFRCTSVTLETEVSNVAAMRLYEERLGFIREELLVRYYLNWGDAYRLRLWFDDEANEDEEQSEKEPPPSVIRGKRRKK